jgi:small-conductance mechanosensitive channel
MFQIIFDQALPPIIAIIVALTVLLAARRAVFGVLTKRARAGSALLDEQLLTLFLTPSILWCLIGALWAGLVFADLPEQLLNPFHTAIHVMLILSITVAASNILVALVRNSLARSASPALGSGIVYGVVRFTVWTLGLLSIFGALGIAVAPLLTAFGVAGLAVGLAFKDTLENAFSGIYLLLDQAIVRGDFVTLETGQKGTIYDIGWRTSKLDGEGGDTLIIPNSKLAQAIVIRRKRSAL